MEGTNCVWFVFRVSQVLASLPSTDLLPSLVSFDPKLSLPRYPTLNAAA